VVTGRVVQRGDQIVVSSELIDARTNHNLWGDQYDRKMSDLLSVQQDITSAISAKLRERLSSEPKKVAQGGTNDPEAYQFYLKGRYYWDKRTQDSLQKSKEFFNQAIQKDPGYAQAYVGLADYYNVISDYSPVPQSEAAAGARSAADKALAIDGSLAEAHNALAASYWSMLEFADAEREFRRALELNPNYANAHHWYGLFLMWDARPAEGLVHLRRSLELDPMNMQYNTNLGQGLGFARQYDASVAQLKKTLEMDPNYPQALGQLSREYFEMGKYDLWLETLKKALLLFQRPDELAIAEEVSKVYSKSGIKSALLRGIELRKKLADHRYVDPADIAYDYAVIGDKDHAFEWLDKAAAEKSGGLQPIKALPEVDSLRSDPRYLALLKRIGMTP
jgi:Tfp pilus assembly protein PilF